jgi:hypothetical protein
MIPTTLIITATFAFLLNPAGNMEEKHLKKEYEIKVLLTKSVEQSLSSHYENYFNISGGNKYKKLTSKSEKLVLELPVESFYETPLEMEEWMKSPKKWNNNEN